MNTELHFCARDDEGNLREAVITVRPSMLHAVSIDDLKSFAGIINAEIRKREPAFTLEAARESRAPFHVMLDDGDSYVVQYGKSAGEDVLVHGPWGSVFPPYPWDQKITHIAKMHWPIGAEWVEVEG